MTDAPGTAPILPGAEPMSTGGGPHGALVLHGFTGNPQSVRGMADALAAAGFAVEMPLLPGHGTRVEDMVDTTWADWSSAAEAAYQALAARVEGRIVVAGLSMGGTLGTWLAGRHPEIAGIALVNPMVEPHPELQGLVATGIAEGTEVFPGIGSDIAKEGAAESAYGGTPLRAVASLLEAVADLQPALAGLSLPVLLLGSAEDHVVPPSNQDHLVATATRADVERVVLERSYHVATLDHDAELIEESVVAFARRMTTEP